MKKIVFVLTQSLDSPSGQGRYGPLARMLVRRGYQVHVLALHPDWKSLSATTFVEEGVKVHYVAPMHVRKQGSRKRYYGPARLLWLSVRASLALAVALARSDAELIHLGKAQPYNVLAARLARRGRPLYVDCDDYEAETNRFDANWQRAVVRYFEDSIVRHATALTVNTNFTATRYAALGFPADKIAVVPNGVERDRFSAVRDGTALRQRWGIADGTPIVAYVGTLGLASHPVDLLLQAMPRVAHLLPAARLMVVGGGEDYDLLQAQAAALGVAEQVIFTGRVSPDCVPGYLAMADVSVDPIHDDLTARARSPLKVVESLVTGTPVITADVGDRREMLKDGQLGLLVPPGDSTALADAIVNLLADDGLRQQMATATIAARESWYWDNLVDQFVRVYALPAGQQGPQIHS